MTNIKNNTRRNFLKLTALGASTIPLTGLMNSNSKEEQKTA